MTIKPVNLKKQKTKKNADRNALFHVYKHTIISIIHHIYCVLSYIRSRLDFEVVLRPRQFSCVLKVICGLVREFL